MIRSSSSFFNGLFFCFLDRHSGKLPYYNTISWTFLLFPPPKSSSVSCTLKILNIFNVLNKYYFSAQSENFFKFRYPWFPSWVLSLTGTMTLKRTLSQKFPTTSKSEEVDIKPSTSINPPTHLEIFFNYY